MISAAAIFGEAFTSNFIPFSNIYARAFVSFIVVTVFLYLVIFLIDKFFKRILSKTKTNLDDEIFAAVERPLYIIAFLFGIGIGLNLLGIDPDILDIFQKVLVTLILFALVFPVYRVTNLVINLWFGKYDKRTRVSIDKKLLPILNRVIKILYFIIFFLLILKLYNLDIGPVLASLGIAGLAVGLALKDTLNNIFSGASIIADKALKIGDMIKLESGEVGIVKDIGLRTTRIQTFDKETILVPNSQLANNRVLNFSLPNPSSRITLEVGVAYGSSIDKVKKVLLDCVRVVDEEILDKDNEPKVYFISMGESSLVFKLIIYITDVSKRFVNEAKLREEIYNKLNKKKINIPFPTRTVYIKK